MTTRIYVGNLPYSFADADLQRVFQPFGGVKFAQVIIDRATGQSRGFGFVEMESPEAMQAAVQGLNGADCEGRALRVNEAREREMSGGPRGPRPAGGFGGAPRPGGFGGAPRPAGGFGGPPPAFGGGGGGGSAGGGGGGGGPGRGGPGGRGQRGYEKKRDNRFDKRDKFSRDDVRRGNRYENE